MQKIIAYTTVEQHDSFELDRAVTNLIHDGWQPYGNFVVVFEKEYNGLMYYQAMVKYEESTP